MNRVPTILKTTEGPTLKFSPNAGRLLHRPTHLRPQEQHQFDVAQHRVAHFPIVLTVSLNHDGHTGLTCAMPFDGPMPPASAELVRAGAATPRPI